VSITNISSVKGRQKKHELKSWIRTVGIEAGMTHINDGRVDSMPTGPFGGEKNSGIGHFGGGGIIEDFTTAHWVTTQRTPKQHPF
jgi:aldehyde dehydrogenase (NAD+)